MNIMRVALNFAAFAAMAFEANANFGGGETIVDIVVGNPDNSALVGALQFTGLISALPLEPKWTLYAPTNKAFCTLGKRPVTDNPIFACYFKCDESCWGPLFEEIGVEALTQVLVFHVSDEKIGKFRIKAGNTPTLAGANNLVATSGRKLYLGPTFLFTSLFKRQLRRPIIMAAEDSYGSKIGKKQVAADGLYYSIDAVLQPFTL